MLKVFFHIRSGNNLISDEEGEACKDLEAAMCRAERALREMLAEDLMQKEGDAVHTRTIEIAGSKGRALARVTLTADIRVLRK